MGGGPSRPAPKPNPQPEQPPEPQQATRRAREDASAIRARRRRGGIRSLLSPTREEATTGLGGTLSGSD